MSCFKNYKDDGKTIQVKVNDSVIASEKLNSDKAKINNITLPKVDQDKYYQVLYKIPASVVKSNIRKISVLDGALKTTKNVIDINFSGLDNKESAKICKSVILMKAFNTANALKELSVNGKKLTCKNGEYNITVPYNMPLKMTLSQEDSNGYVEVEDAIFDESKSKEIAPKEKNDKIKIRVYAEDFETFKEYVLNINSDYKTLNWDIKNAYVKGFDFDENVNDSYAVLKGKMLEKANISNYNFGKGIENTSIKLNGEYGLKLLEDASVLGNSYSISFWMKPENVGHTYNPTLMAGTFSPEYWLNLTTDGKLWSSNGAWVSADATNSYEANK